MAASRYVAFLRAINVGGHVVKMADLRRIFERQGLREVETFIASGNVIFSADARDLRALEAELETRLERALGFEVATFVRTVAQVVAIARHSPWTPAERAAASLYVGFLRGPLGPPGRKQLMALQTEIDAFHVKGPEVYWLCRTRQGESTFSNAVFERRAGVRSTWRGVSTVVRIADRYGASTRAG